MQPRNDENAKHKYTAPLIRWHLQVRREYVDDERPSASATASPNTEPRNQGWAVTTSTRGARRDCGRS